MLMLLSNGKPIGVVQTQLGSERSLIRARAHELVGTIIDLDLQKDNFEW
jgi:hypothetical protein